MTTLTDREKALVEAAREIAALWTQIAGEKYLDHMQLKMIYALRAYDSPKEKVPVIPAWDELTKHGCVGVDANCGQFILWNGVPLYQNAYNHLRELTAKEQE